MHSFEDTAKERWQQQGYTQAIEDISERTNILKKLRRIFHRHKWHYLSADLFDRECIICGKYENWNSGLMEYD